MHDPEDAVRRSRPFPAVAAVAALLLLAACGSGGGDGGAGGSGTLTIYSGRVEPLVGPLLEQFERDSGIDIEVRYAGTAELAAQIMEEGSRSRADVFLSQDAGALGALTKRGLLATAPAEAVGVVDSRFRARDNTWVGVSGRARVIAANSQRVPDAEVPRSVSALTEARWRGRVGIAPTNASFQAFVTAMRVQAGEDRTREWLQGLKANEPKTYQSNGLVLRAVNDGEVDLGLVNHYYLYELIEELGPERVVARNHFTANGDPGALVNVAGVGILRSTDAPEAAATFVNYLLSPSAQRYFAEETHEYPMVAGVPTAPNLPPLSQIQSPDIDLSDLDTLEATLMLLQDVGLL
jgi:iron(III) transport system substrate-binding protein